MEISLYSIPALLVLVAKAGILLYARTSTVKDLAAKLFLIFLVALTVQNIAEIGILNFHGPEFVSHDTFLKGYVYFVASVIAMAVLVHLTLVLAIDWGSRMGSPLLTSLIYLPALVLSGLFLGSDYIVSGFTQLNYTYGQIAGPGYWLFELYTLAYCTTTLAVLYYGARNQNTPSKKLKNKLMGFGMLPMGAVVLLVMTLQHQGFAARFNTTATLPLAITIFLAVTAYAIHQYRLFDIEFYIPGSRVRKRKTAFYNRIRQLVAEIAELPSAEKAVSSLAATLKCPIVLLDGQHAVVASAGNARNMAAIPPPALSHLTHIAVRDELYSALPEMYRKMTQYHISAIVPFYPRNRRAAGWLLMGESFNEQVYSPQDFKMVEQLFDKMADLFLEGMVSMRTEIDDTEDRLQKLEHSHQQLVAAYQKLENENEDLQRNNIRLLREQPADSFSLISTASQESSIPATVTLLGRDKPMLEQLREHFPHTSQYVAPSSLSFKRQSPSDVLVCQIEDDGTRGGRSYLKLMTERRGKSAFLLYGSGVPAFVHKYHKELLGGIIEVLPTGLPAATLIRRVNAIAELRKAVCSVTEPDNPLIGRSQVFIDTIADAIRMSRFFDPVLIKSTDAGEAAAVAAYIHHQGATNGEFVLLRASDLDTTANLLSPHDEQKVRQLIKKARSGSLMIDNITGLRRDVVDRLLALVQANGNVRLMAGYEPGATSGVEEIPQLLQTFTLELPRLSERKNDLQLLAHYFTLLHNLQATHETYLDQSELESLQLDHHTDSLAVLKNLIFERLGNKEGSKTQSFANYSDGKTKTLEEHVAEFEAAIIKETLERCDGNKSKAAKLLGLRPNTLHYKLARHGMGTSKKKQDSDY
jgi:DNA-binding NtrC family response regulator